MKRKELEKHKGSSAVELSKVVATKRDELWKTMNEIKKGTTKNVRAARGVRRDIAQLMTLMNNQETK